MPNNPTAPFTIYSSSAGSGKTYTLAREYVWLALQQPDAFAQLLAVTFTNKATHEMKTRVVTVLYALAAWYQHPQAQQGPAPEMLDELALRLQARPEALREARVQARLEVAQKAYNALHYLLHNYGRFAISTIDAFFQRVLRSFARELGLRGGYQIELDQDKVLGEVVDNLLLRLEHKDTARDESLAQWLVQLARERVRDSKNWDPRFAILNLARQLLDENFKQHERAVLNKAAQRSLLQKFKKDLQALTQQFENTLANLAQQALDVLQNHGLEPTDLSYGKTGVGGYLQRLAAKQSFEGDKYLPGKRINDAATGELKFWASKTSKQQEQILAALNAGLLNALLNVLDHIDQHNRAYRTARETMRHLPTLGILYDVALELKQYRQDNDLILISDAAALLRKVIDENEAPFIYEKTGSLYHHFLIDEFQDTSRFQWQNFKPLVLNAMAEQQANLVVGDVKQSIYRWRGGDWRLLLNGVTQDMRPEQYRTEALDTNWRSLPNIVAFNNTFFMQAAHHLQQKLVNELDDAGLDDEPYNLLMEQVQQIGQAYQHTHQKVRPNLPPNTPGGQVCIEWLENQKTTPEQALARLPQLVQHWQNKGFAAKDMVVLVRTKAEGRLVVDALMAHKEQLPPNSPYNFEVVSNESLYLGHVPVVRLLVAALRYLHNETDAVARADMAYAYQQYQSANSGNAADSTTPGKALANTNAIHQLFYAAGAGSLPPKAPASPPLQEDATTKAATPTKPPAATAAPTEPAATATKAATPPSLEPFLPPALSQRKEVLNKLPLYELSEELIALFGLDQQPGQYAYLQAWQDAVLHYASQQKGHLMGFLSWWDDEGHETALQMAQEANAIRVMTIHKSKGLEFEVVLMPFAHWKLDPVGALGGILWCKTAQPPFDQVPLLPMKYVKALQHTYFGQEYFEEKLSAHLDNLNVLYVALTRARQVLHLMAPQPGTDKKGNQKAAALQDAAQLLAHTLDQPMPQDLVAQHFAQPHMQGHQHVPLPPFDAQQPQWQFGHLDQKYSKSQAQEAAQPAGQEATPQAPAATLPRVPEPQPIALESYPTFSWRQQKNKLRIRPEALAYFKAEATGTLKHIRQGRLVHDILARIETHAEIPAALRRVQQQGQTDAAGAAALQQKLEAWLGAQPLQQWYSGQWQVRNESLILTTGGRRRVRPDRVMLRGPENAVQEALVVEYKTGQPHESHKKQVSFYATLLAQMGYSPVTAYLVYLEEETFTAQEVSWAQ